MCNKELDLTPHEQKTQGTCQSVILLPKLQVQCLEPGSHMLGIPKEVLITSEVKLL